MRAATTGSIILMFVSACGSPRDSRDHASNSSRASGGAEVKATAPKVSHLTLLDPQPLVPVDFEHLGTGYRCVFDGPRGNILLVAEAPESPSGHAKAEVKLGKEVVDLVAREAGDYELLVLGRRFSFVESNVIVTIDVSDQEPEPVSEETSEVDALMTLRMSGETETRKITGQWSCDD